MQRVFTSLLRVHVPKWYLLWSSSTKQGTTLRAKSIVLGYKDPWKNIFGDYSANRVGFGVEHGLSDSKRVCTFAVTAVAVIIFISKISKTTNP